MFILKWTELHQCKKKNITSQVKVIFLEMFLGKADLCQLPHEALARTGLHLYFSFSRTDRSRTKELGMFDVRGCRVFNIWQRLTVIHLVNSRSPRAADSKVIRG